MAFRDAYRIVGAEVTALLDRHETLPVESQEQLIATPAKHAAIWAAQVTWD